MDINDAYLPLFWPWIGDDEGNKPTPKRYNVLKGGAGSGKSHALAQYIFFLVTARKDFKVLAMHKIENKIRDTVFEELRSVIKENNALDQFDIITSPFKITCKTTGSHIIFRGLDDPDKLKSISGVGLIWLEEADIFELADFEQADLRMRGKSEWPYQMLISFNPTSELSWLKATFFDEETMSPDVAENLLLIETTFEDNPYLDEPYKKVLFSKSPEYRRVYMYGEWGRTSSEGLFYKCFDSTVHTSKAAVYNPDLPVWLSFDFNVNPHVTCEVCQLQDDQTLWVVDEITLPSPKNSTKYTAQAFLARYPDHQAGVFITGDPAGKHQDTRNERGFNDYSIIQKELKVLRPVTRVDEKAPPIIPRGNFINDIFSLEWEGYSILINPKCKVLIKDLTYQKESPTGKDKSKVRTKEGISIEKYGHASDAFDYVVSKVFAKGLASYLRPPKPEKNYMLGKNQLSSRYR